MIVVCNTSPLTNLAVIGQFPLLHQLYGRLHIAEGVWDELNARGQHWPDRGAVGFLHRQGNGRATGPCCWCLRSWRDPDFCWKRSE
jgi:hypothetical protein